MRQILLEGSPSSSEFDNELPRPFTRSTRRSVLTERATRSHHEGMRTHMPILTTIAALSVPSSRRAVLGRARTRRLHSHLASHSPSLSHSRRSLFAKVGVTRDHLTRPVDAIQDDYQKLPLVARVALEAAQSLDNDGKHAEAYVQVRSCCSCHNRQHYGSRVPDTVTRSLLDLTHLA